MAKTHDRTDRGTREGHGDTSHAPNVKKGQYHQVGSVVELNHKPISTDQKSGHEGGGREAEQGV